jgi:hypothetical protein
MKQLLRSLLMLLLTACAPDGGEMPRELLGFIGVLRENGVDGTLTMRRPVNEDMEYVAEYAIARYTSTRIISFFKCGDAEGARTNLEAALKNPKLSGQARNGSYLMATTFYPPDPEAVERIRALFLAHRFE